MQVKTKPKSFKLVKLNFFAIPLMAFAGITALGISFINYNPEDFASASNDSTIKSTISYSDEYITISNNSVIDLGSSEVTADSSYVYATDNVTVSTNVPTGYDLYLSSSNNESASLKNPDSYTEIAATSGTGGSGGTPKALDPDSYGYAVSSSLIGNTSFDADYANPTATSKWAGIPTGTSDRIHSTSTATPDGDTTAVHYGANLTNYLAPGEYTGKVTYSAVVTPSDNDIEMSVSPNFGGAGTSFTINSGPNNMISTSHTLDSSEVSVIFYQNDEIKGYCNVDNINPRSGHLVTTCTIPDTLKAGAYDVEIIVPRFGFKDIKSDAFTVYDTMQNYTTTKCNALELWSNTDAPTGSTITLLDARDSRLYSVRRLADGHCWMVQNLNLQGGTTVESTKSDVTSSYKLPSSSTSGFNNSNTAYVYNNNSNPNYGGYYSWYAATASTGTTSTGAGSDASASICPKGWKLPPNSGTYSWYTLYTAYSSTQQRFQTATNTGSNYWAGYYYYYNGSTSNTGIGASGYWQSRTAASSTNMYGLFIYNYGGNFYPQRDSLEKVRGGSVRCVFVGS